MSVTNLELIKAVWAAGFRAGHSRGGDEVASYERGYAKKAQTPEQAWDEHVEWLLNREDPPFDMTNTDEWEGIP